MSISQGLNIVSKRKTRPPFIEKMVTLREVCAMCDYSYFVPHRYWCSQGNASCRAEITMKNRKYLHNHLNNHHNENQHGALQWCPHTVSAGSLGVGSQDYCLLEHPWVVLHYMGLYLSISTNEGYVYLPPFDDRFIRVWPSHVGGAFYQYVVHASRYS